jgi:multidrug efflux system outer membrane protein
MNTRPCSRVLLAAAFCGLLLAAGCAIGPRYQRPPVNPPSTFRNGSPDTNVFLAEPDWWQVYEDPTLQALIREAFTNNYDLRIAAARVEQSRAVAMQARSPFFPGVTYNGTAGRGRNDVLGSPFSNGGATVDSAAVTLNAFWEVDLWGRVRRLNESARAQLLASEEARRGVRLTLLSDVATAYFQLLELDSELEIASQATNSFAESLGIFSQRLNGGTASALESSRAEAAFEDAAATVPAIRLRISNLENQLSILLGRNPGPIQRTRGRSAVDSAPAIPTGLPSALLERRPDIRAAEQQLRSANAQVGGAIAGFFPRIGLTALLGRVSPELSAFTFGRNNVWGVAAQGAGSLFEGGRLVGQYRESKAARNEAGLRYRQVVLNAFREVSDALAAREELTEVCAHQAREVAALEAAVRLSSQRYVAGKAGYYELLEAQQQLFPAQLNLARTRRDQLLAVVALYKALGGGWPDEAVATVNKN